MISPIEIWGGFECSVVRVNDRFRNQIVETGHDRRISDLDAVAELRIRTLRYPVLMETVAPDDPRERDWRWHDQRLQRLRDLGITVIAGLIHHGSGPRYTNLLDPRFPELVAEFAGRVARRYPWIEHYTPVNEPLTTARFSGLYGHWYPHGTDEASCFRMLVNQCRAIALAMRAVREINPGAKLVQTEDSGKVFATRELQYQADYENERRWLSFDLLTGRVDRRHPFRARFKRAGIDAAVLDSLAGEPCPPTILGLDHYLTSDRFLDHRLERHAGEAVGGNQRRHYIDVAAARADVPREQRGAAARIRETWERYRLPIAITEIHNGCTRDEQLRWLLEGWSAAKAARAAGIDMRAITAWTLLGTVDWDSLLTLPTAAYESGVFDVRWGAPRPTALAGAIKSLLVRGSFDHPVLDRAGWWLGHRQADSRKSPRKLMILGDNALARVLRATCLRRGLDSVNVSGRSRLSPSRLDRIVDRYGVWAIVDAGGTAIRPLRELASLVQDSVTAPAAMRVSQVGETRRHDAGTVADLLHVKVARPVDPELIANTALDLLIDGEQGEWHLILQADGRLLAIAADATPLDSGWQDPEPRRDDKRISKTAEYD